MLVISPVYAMCDYEMICNYNKFTDDYINI